MTAHALISLLFQIRKCAIAGILHVQLLDKTNFFASPEKEKQDKHYVPRYGSAVTDGVHKAEAYFLYADAKTYMPGHEVDIMRFRTETVGT